MSMTWRQRMGLVAAYSLLGVTVPVMSGWTADAACRTWVREEVSAASNQDREPHQPGAVHNALCSTARWIVEHTP
mgnify:CR=1 FL=1